MYQITIDYTKYLCGYGDLTEVINALQKIRKIETNGDTKTISFSVEEAIPLEDIKSVRISELQKESQQRAEWWIAEQNKNKELKAKLEEYQRIRRKDEEIPF